MPILFWCTKWLQATGPRTGLARHSNSGLYTRKITHEMLVARRIAVHNHPKQDISRTSCQVSGVSESEPSTTTSQRLSGTGWLPINGLSGPGRTTFMTKSPSGSFGNWNCLKNQITDAYYFTLVELQRQIQNLWQLRTSPLLCWALANSISECMVNDIEANAEKTKHWSETTSTIPERPFWSEGCKVPGWGSKMDPNGDKTLLVMIYLDLFLHSYLNEVQSSQVPHPPCAMPTRGGVALLKVINM